jgi:3-isopropylmalate dehydrogenase
MKNFSIAVIPGDGIGPEVTREAVKALKKAGEIYGAGFHFENVEMGGNAIDLFGTPLPQRTVDICRQSDSVLLGAVGGPKWDGLAGDMRPEKGLLGIRSALGLYANLRHAVLFPELRDSSPLRPELTKRGIDIMMVRELIGGIYFGERGRRRGEHGEEAYDTEKYSEPEIERIGRVAFEAALRRRGSVVSVDKANVLESSRLWRSVMHALAAEYSGVSFSDMLVDNAAMQLMRDPSQFDVIVTSNMFGDILSDEASMAAGSLGMLPSASLGAPGTPGLYEPVHGSAPDIAGRGTANPIAAVLSAAMMLRYSLAMPEAAAAIERAVSSVLREGYRTADIAPAGSPVTGTVKMGGLIAEAIE